MPKLLPATISLKTRVLLLFSVLIVASVWGLASVMASMLQDDMEEMISRQLSGSLDYITEELQHEIHFRFEALNKLAASITPAIQADPERLQRLLQQSDLSATLFPDGVTCVNRQGLIVADAPVVAGRRGGSLRDRSYFREIMAGARQAISNPVQARFVNKPIVALAVSLRDTLGATSGMVLGLSELSDPDLFGKLEQASFGKTGYFIVLSPKDRVIVSATDKSRIMTSLPPRGVNPLLDRRLEEGFEGAGISTTSLGIETLTLSRHMKGTDWMVVAGITTEEAFAPIAKLKYRIYLGALLISLLVALILRFALKRQLAPLEMAATAMRRMSDGETPLAPISVVRRDEIGQLVGNFNNLVEERRRSEAEIRNLNETLERRVLERTAELNAVNLNLEKEIGERKSAESSVMDFAARLKVMTRRLANAQEAERRKLARELHDRVASSLMAIGLNLELIAKQLPPETTFLVSGRIADSAELVKDTMLNAREISHDLHPAVLDYGGVFGALEDYGLKFTGRTGIAVALAGNGRDIRRPPETEIALYRIAQEALTNCAKHASARSVTITLDGDADYIQFVIADDGIGFNPGQLGHGENTPGLGLLAMRERAEAVGGTFRLESAPGSGTRITVEI